MVDVIYLKKSGLHTRFKKKYHKIDRPISYYLHHSIKIEKGFTVQHLMEILKEYEKDVDLIFQAYTRGFKLEPFYNEMNKPMEKNDKNPMVQIEFQWVGEVDNYKEFGKPKYQISDDVQIMGLREKGNNPGWAIDFIPLNELKDACLKLNPKISFSYTDYGDRWEEDRKPKTILFFKGIKEFLFEDIIGAFLHEITFCGYPEHRKQKIKELDESIESYEKEKGIPAEKLFLEFTEKSLANELKKKDSKTKTLRIEKYEKEIAYYKKKLEEYGTEEKNN